MQQCTLEGLGGHSCVINSLVMCIFLRSTIISDKWPDPLHNVGISDDLELKILFN